MHTKRRTGLSKTYERFCISSSPNITTSAGFLLHFYRVQGTAFGGFGQYWRVIITSSEVIMFPADILLALLAFCRVVIGLVFSLSSISKGRIIAQFQQTIRQFHILPSSLSQGAA